MKKRLRTEKLLERLKHHPAEKLQKDLEIAKQISGTEAFIKAKTILIYMPIHGEVDLKPLYSGQNFNKNIILPKVKSSTELDLHKIDKPDELKPGKFKIPEPEAHHPKVNPEELDLVLVPGIVFARDGHRIGYGKGFYDHLLKNVKCPKIGIAYEFQMVENIPAEPHDTPMDIIVTEKNIYHINKP